MIPYALLLVSILAGVGGQLLLKAEMTKYTQFQITELFALLFEPPIIGGFFCYGCSLLVYLVVLQTVPLSFAFPTVSLGYALVVVLSRALFNEPVNMMRWIAVALICAGVVLAGLGAA